MSNEVRLMHLENRLNKLMINPIQNTNLMRKVNRQIRKIKGQ